MSDKKRLDQQITLNFFPLAQQRFSFFVYRKETELDSKNQDRGRHDGVRRYHLPKEIDVVYLKWTLC